LLLPPRQSRDGVVRFSPQRIVRRQYCKKRFGDDPPQSFPDFTADNLNNKGALLMSTTDELLTSNQQYASKFDQGNLAMPPARKVAILACMDARLSVEQLLGLKTGDAHVIRNAGGIATEDALRSLIISHHLLGTQEFLVINHTDCGMLTFNDAELRDKLETQTGVSVVAPAHFHAFKDVEQNVRQQVARIKNHPYVRDIPVRGFVYDVKSGQLAEVAEQRPRASQQSA
jgi:carbonic anhydrase